LIKKTGRQNGSRLKVAYLIEYVLMPKAFIHAPFKKFCIFTTARADEAFKNDNPGRWPGLS
jgi:hypothetical protein